MLLAQDGHNRSNKIVEALKKEIIDGAIFSPRYQTSDVLTETISTIRKEFKDKFFLLDPMFYVSAMQATKTGKLETYSYFVPKLGRKDFSSKNIQKFVKEVVDFQLKLGLEYIISPSVVVPSFTSYMAQITIQLSIEASEYLKTVSPESKLIICLPVGESSLREDEQLSNFLDDLTTLDAFGYYIFVERATANMPQWTDPTTLSGLLYLVNVLAENGYQVYVGFIDIVGILTIAVGAKALANGWYRNQCLFTSDRFFEQPPRRQAREVYSSEPLLNSVYIDPELQAIFELGMIDDVLTGSNFDNVFKKDPITQPWPQDTAVMHQWATLKRLVDEIETVNTKEERISLIQKKIDNAQSLYSKLRTEGVEFEAASGPNHLRVWQEALTLFQQI